MKALVGAFNQEKALVGAFSVIVQPVVEPMEQYTELIWILDINITFLQSLPVPVSGSVAPVLLGTIYQAVIQAAGEACHLASSQHRIVIN